MKYGYKNDIKIERQRRMKNIISIFAIIKNDKNGRII